MSFTAVTTTTIHVPTFYDDVCRNARDHGHEDIRFYVIGDYKTPDEIEPYLQKTGKEYGYIFEYFDVDRQKAYTRKHPDLEILLPYNWGGRKMLANFMCYEEGAERAIMLDDDNFVGSNDFFGFHKQAGRDVEMKTVSSPDGWFNVYKAVIEKSGIPIYPRSYPWSMRFLEDAKTTMATKTVRIGAINGFVLEDPDVDAISRLFWPIRVEGMRGEYKPGFALGQGTWCSWNNQNTSVSREMLGAYFTPASTGRNGDIWTAYVICKLAEHMNEVVAFGEPLVTQHRNPHNLWRDLEDELVNNKATDAFTEMLRSIPLSKTDHNSTLKELIARANDVAADMDLPDDQKQMIQEFWREYAIWNDLVISVA